MPDLVFEQDLACRRHAFRSRLGWAELIWDDERLSSLRFGYAGAADIAPPSRGISVEGRYLRPVQREAVRRIQRYLQGARVDFLDLPHIATANTPFAKMVIEICKQIDRGETKTYAEVAAEAGSPGAARAVGNVMRSNPLPLIIPCHRIVGANGTLGGYSAPGGLLTKAWLLAMERRDEAGMREISRQEDWLFARSCGTLERQRPHWK